MIFEKGRRSHHDFYIYNSVIELVDSFKYLGITLFKNSNWLNQDSDRNNNYNGYNWASQIKTILQQHGFEYVWLQQSDIDIPFHYIRQRIVDTYQQSWYSEINNSSRLVSYCVFKHNFKLEKYLTLNIDQKYKLAFTRFRTSSHSLFIENGRYENKPREQRICQLCNMNKIENEFHFLLVCPKYRELRQKYFKPYFCHWPTWKKIETILSMKTVNAINCLAKFIYFASKKRNA